MKCSVCGKGGCKTTDRNVDGTYSHPQCLYATAYWPTKEKKNEPAK